MAGFVVAGEVRDLSGDGVGGAPFEEAEQRHEGAFTHDGEQKAGYGVVGFVEEGLE